MPEVETDWDEELPYEVDETDPSDEHGNIWMEDAVPSGQEIAEVMLEVIADKGWQAAWGDCQGMSICPRVRVWLDGYMDWDYEQVFLLRVWTDSEPYDNEGRTLTLTDHLAIYSHGRLDVEWRQDPRLFFDALSDWQFSGYRWWIDWIEALVEAEREGQSPIHSDIPEKHQQRARAMGLNLPYLQEEEAHA